MKIFGFLLIFVAIMAIAIIPGYQAVVADGNSSEVVQKTSAPPSHEGVGLMVLGTLVVMAGMLAMATLGKIGILFLGPVLLLGGFATFLIGIF